VATLASLGSCFDAASQQEIKQVLDLGVEPQRIIFAHPRKSENAIRYAREHGVSVLITDSQEELHKILELHPLAKIVVRIKTDDSHSQVPLSTKFGASLEEAREIIDLLAERNQISALHGISFHVGSNNQDPDAHDKAIREVSSLFSYARDTYQHEISLLDLGGGWVGEDKTAFAAQAAASSRALAELIPPATTIIAEPGRFFAAVSTLIVTKILGKKTTVHDGAISNAYYLSDGAYGSFLTAISYHYDRPAIESEGFRLAPLFPVAPGTPVYPTRLWGPTCDSYDRLYDLTMADLPSGAYLYTANAGAYSTATRTRFNGMEASHPEYGYFQQQVDQLWAQKPAVQGGLPRGRALAP
jgi:ornithine decarboxylase